MKCQSMLLLLFLTIFGITPCWAFDWGDWHKISVVGATLIFFGLGFFGIVYVAYLGCMRPFFDNFREEVVQTHRTWHPWPIGSVRWQLQRLLRTDRSGRTSFPATSPLPQKPLSAEYLNVPTLQNTLVQPAPYYLTSDNFPTLRSTDSAFNQPYSIPHRSKQISQFENKPIFEEYTITREESFTSRGGRDGQSRQGGSLLASGYNQAANIQEGMTHAFNMPPGDTKIIRTTTMTTRQSQRSKSAGSTFI